MTHYTGTVPSFLSGEIMDSSKLAEITDFMSAMVDPWTAYTPTWSSSGTPIVLGNSTIAGKFSRVGKFVRWRMRFVVGNSGVTVGTGNYFFTLPVAAFNDITPDMPIGAGYLLDTSVQVRYRVTATCPNVNQLWVNVGDNNPGVWQAGAPFAAAVGDSLSVGGIYECA